MEGREWLRKLKSTLRKRKTVPPAPHWPEWYLDYATAYEENPPHDHQLLTETDIIVIDAETTGLNLKQDQLISLGALKVRGTSIFIQNQFEGYLPTPSGHQDKGAISIHGILPNSKRYAYDQEEDLLQKLLQFLGSGSLIVGHHIGFDVSMINQALARQGAGPLQNKVIDTAKLAERLQPAGYWTPPEKFSLDNLARRYRIPLSDRHTALGDAYITAVLWLKLTARLAKKVGRGLKVEDL